jgi:hypothetical protein
MPKAMVEIPDYYSLMLPLLKLAAHGETVQRQY